MALPLARHARSHRRTDELLDMVEEDVVGQVLEPANDLLVLLFEPAKSGLQLALLRQAARPCAVVRRPVEVPRTEVPRGRLPAGCAQTLCRANILLQ